MGDDADSPHIVTCYVDDNDNVYATCSHPDTLADGSATGLPHRRLGSLHAEETNLENPVVVKMRFLQNPPQFPSSAFFDKKQRRSLYTLLCIHFCRG